MFSIYWLKLFTGLIISMGVFVQGNPQPGQSFSIVANVSESQAKTLNTRIVLSSSLELVELRTEPLGTCVVDQCMTMVDSASEVMVIAVIRAKEKAPIGLATIQLSAFDDLGNSASTVKSVFVGTMPNLILHRKVYLSIIRR